MAIHSTTGNILFDLTHTGHFGVSNLSPLTGRRLTLQSKILRTTLRLTRWNNHITLHHQKHYSA